MKQHDLFPKISAQIFKSPNNTEEFFLFNTTTNKGFAIDGFAAVLCKKLTGDRTLNEVIAEFEIEQKLAKDEYKTEISDLLTELEKNRLLVFHNTAQELEEK